MGNLCGNLILELRVPGIFPEFPNNIRDVLEKSWNSHEGFCFQLAEIFSALFRVFFLGTSLGFGGSLECWDPSEHWEKLGMLLGDETPGLSAGGSQKLQLKSI